MSEATLTLDNRDEAILLFGNRDQNLRTVRDALGVRIVARGDTLVIDGADEQVGQAERVFQQLLQMVRKHGKLNPDDVRTVVDLVQHGGDRLTPQSASEPGGTRYVRPRTDGQARYVRAMQENDLTFCIGPAGTGKTFLGVGMAVSLLRQGQVKRIVLVPPYTSEGWAYDQSVVFPNWGAILPVVRQSFP